MVYFRNTHWCSLHYQVTNFLTVWQEAAQSRLAETSMSESPPSPAVPGMLTPPPSKNKGRTSAPLSPVNGNLLTPSTVNSESPRCSTTSSEWDVDQPAQQSAHPYSW